MENLWDDDFIPFEKPSNDETNQPVKTPKLESQKYTLAGVDVKFPFPAYQNQLDMMEKVNQFMLSSRYTLDYTPE